jgi:proteasome lid subunit RPN8/RPN11
MESVQIRPATYQFRLEFWRRRGQSVAEVPLDEADFARATEAAFFDGLCRGRFPRYDPPQAGVRFEPRFIHPEGGSPRTRGFEVVVPTPNGGEHRVEFPTRFFTSRAKRVFQELLESGRVPVNTLLLFHLAAYLDGGPRSAARPSGITLEPVAATVPIRAGLRQALGVTEAWDDPRPRDLPVLIPRRILEEAVAEAQRDPEREVGGILLGHLRRDPETAEMFLEVACHVPAEETQATGASVTFTATTWARAREVAELRGEGEIIAGWVHSHPFLFDEPCPEPVPAELADEILFFSTDDKFLMELTFPRPFMVALQTGIEPRLEKALGHLPVRLYGWRRGEIVSRGFEVFDD